MPAAVNKTDRMVTDCRCQQGTLVIGVWIISAYGKEGEFEGVSILMYQE